MLTQGRIALLFDGFDELALRVSYDRAVEPFRAGVSLSPGGSSLRVGRVKSANRQHSALTIGYAHMNQAVGRDH
jgi:hypothetical protein